MRVPKEKISNLIGSFLISTITKVVEKIQEKDIKKFKRAPKNFLPLEMTIILSVASAFSVIFNKNKKIYVIGITLY